MKRWIRKNKEEKDEAAASWKIYLDIIFIELQIDFSENPSLFAIQMSRINKYRASFIKRPLRANVVLDEGIPRRNNTEKLSSSLHQCHPLNGFLITLNICNWSLKFASPNVMVAAHEMFALSSCVTRSFTANECTSSFWENVVTVSHLKRRMKAMRAGLCDESGITVRKKYGNSSRSLRAGAVLPNDT